MPVVMSLLETVTNWQGLAFSLGIYFTTVEKINMERRGNVERCLRDVIRYWLAHRDDVKELGGCTKQRLVTALQDINENSIADKILGMFLPQPFTPHLVLNTCMSTR